MSILILMVVGLVVGALAKLIMPGKDPGGIWITMLLGIAGSLVAGLVGHAFGWYAAGQGPGLIAAILGSVLILAVYRTTRPTSAN